MNGVAKNIVLVGLVVLVAGGLFYSHRQIVKQKNSSAVAVAPKTILAFLGAPGSGKGTLAKQAVSQLHFKSLSTGDLCREEVASGSEKGKMIAQYMQGGLIPDEVMTDMVDGWLSKQAGTEPIILDGYPRTQKQAAMLADLLKTKFADYTFGAVSLVISNEEEVVQRIANRVVCEQCKAVYSRTALKDATTCPACGGKLITREDDKEEIVRQRLATFNKNNAEIIAYYKEIGVPVQEINVSGVTPEQIFQDFKKLLAVYAPKEAAVETCSCTHCACSAAHEAAETHEAPAAQEVAEVVTQDAPAAHDHVQPEPAIIK